MRSRTFLVMVAGLLLGAGCGKASSGSGSYLKIDFTAASGASAPDPIYKLEIYFVLPAPDGGAPVGAHVDGGMMDWFTSIDHRSSAIELPTSAVFDVQHGEGAMDITVTGFAIDGTTRVASGTQHVDFRRGRTTPITVMLTRIGGPPPVDGGTDGGGTDGGGTDGGKVDVSPSEVVLKLAIVGGSGCKVSDEAGHVCNASSCEWSYPSGSGVRLTATGSAGTCELDQWSGDCQGYGSSCALTMNVAKAVTANVTGPRNRIFATAETYFVTGLSPEKADLECAARAVAGGLANQRWVAWFSGLGNDAGSRLRTANAQGGWVRTDGRPFVTDLSALTSGKILYPPNLDQGGRPVTGSVLTATKPDGTFSSDCTGSPPMIELGTLGGGTQLWSSSGAVACDISTVGHLYCLGVDFSTAVALPKETGKLAFVSGPVAGNSNMDDQCNAMAQKAALTGTYRALVGFSGESALQHLGVVTGPWFRRDGVMVAAGPDARSFLSLTAPIDVGFDATYGPRFVWTGGMIDSVVATTMNCSDWTQGSSSMMGEVGQAALSSSGAFELGTSNACSLTASVYCVQVQ